MGSRPPQGDADARKLSGFAPLRTSDGALTIMLVNKLAAAASASLALANFPSHGLAERWQLTGAYRIDHLSNLACQGDRLDAILPGQVSLLIVRPAATTRHRVFKVSVEIFRL